MPVNIFLRCFPLPVVVKYYLQVFKALINLAEFYGPAFYLRYLSEKFFG
jgi:hypothetical protein